MYANILLSKIDSLKNIFNFLSFVGQTGLQKISANHVFSLSQIIQYQLFSTKSSLNHSFFEIKLIISKNNQLYFQSHNSSNKSKYGEKVTFNDFDLTIASNLEYFLSSSKKYFSYGFSIKIKSR
jgi:hypothetical protein